MQTADTFPLVLFCIVLVYVFKKVSCQPCYLIFRCYVAELSSENKVRLNHASTHGKKEYSVLKRQIDWIKIKAYKVIASYKARETYPESIDLNLDDLLAKPRIIKVVIIDDAPFPWIEAIESRGCSVSYHQDYTKPIVQSNQKIKTISTKSSDIIICDINGVGSAIYPGMDGVGVIEELRRKHPLHVIIAYTGNPGAIHAKLKSKTTLDGIMVRDWEIDDFLFNFDEILKIYRSPAQRWQFIKNRLKHLGLKEKEIDGIRRKYVENIILGKLLNEKLHFTSTTAQEILTKENNINLGALAKVGIGAIEAWGLLSPFIPSGN